MRRPDALGGPRLTDRPKRSWIDTALAKTKRALEVGSEAADVLVHLQGGPTPVGLAAVGMRVVNSVREHRSKAAEEFFGDGWTRLDLGILEPNVYEAILAADATPDPVPGVYDEMPAVTVNLGDHTFGFALSGRTRRHGVHCRSCWIPQAQDREASIRAAGRILWESIDAFRVILTPRGGEKRALELVPEDDRPVFSSSMGDTLYERMKQFLDAGHHRSVFVLGEPGVGKTEMLRYIASLHGGFQVRIKLGDMKRMKGSDLTRIVEILRPDVLLVDDFDRFVSGSGSWREEDKGSPAAAAMLDPVERINDLVPLFMVSANFSERITAAMLRPGRFDEPITITEVDPEIYQRLLPDAPKKLIDELKRVKAPAAYVQELRKRVEVLGYNDAVKEMKDLMRRSKRAVDLNKRRTKGRKAKPGATLVGKSPRQKAGVLERRAASEERRSGKLIEKAEKARLSAERLREKAESERKKAATQEKSAKARKKDR